MNFFVNESEGRIRAGWRILIFLVLFIFVMASLQLFSGQIGVASWVGQVFFAMATLLSMWVMALMVDLRPFTDFGFDMNKRWAIECLRGAAWGIGLILILAGISYALGSFEVVETFGWNISVATAFVTMVGVSVAEESMFRGYFQKNLEEGFQFLGKEKAMWVSVLIISLGFSAAHGFNPNLTLLALLNIALAGILLGLSYVLTRSLAWPIGFHLTWNWFQGGFLGVPVSGLEMEGYFKTALGGPAWLTGGNFGFEGGLLCSILLIALTLLLFKLYGPVTYPEREGING